MNPGLDWNLTAKEQAALQERMDRWVDSSAGPDECWPWTGYRKTGGLNYGFIHVMHNGRKSGMAASRAAYIAEHGGISGDQCVLHSCDNPPCCNPRHLRAGTTLENARDRVERGRQRRGADTARSIQISDETIAEIRAAYVPWSRDACQQVLADRYGLTRAIVCNIVARRGRWAEDVAA